MKNCDISKAIYSDDIYALYDYLKENYVDEADARLIIGAAEDADDAAANAGLIFQLIKVSSDFLRENKNYFNEAGSVGVDVDVADRAVIDYNINSLKAIGVDTFTFIGKIFFNIF